MMQVPLPQQRGSSVILNSMMSASRHSARPANLKRGEVIRQFVAKSGLGTQLEHSARHHRPHLLGHRIFKGTSLVAVRAGVIGLRVPWPRHQPP
jgi:hypothetical protein